MGVHLFKTAFFIRYCVRPSLLQTSNKRRIFHLNNLKYQIALFILSDCVTSAYKNKQSAMYKTCVLYLHLAALENGKFSRYETRVLDFNRVSTRLSHFK